MSLQVTGTRSPDWMPALLFVDTSYPMTVQCRRVCQTCGMPVYGQASLHMGGIGPCG